MVHFERNCQNVPRAAGAAAASAAASAVCILSCIYRGARSAPPIYSCIKIYTAEAAAEAAAAPAAASVSKKKVTSH